MSKLDCDLTVQLGNRYTVDILTLLETCCHFFLNGCEKHISPEVFFHFVWCNKCSLYCLCPINDLYNTRQHLCFIFTDTVSLSKHDFNSHSLQSNICSSLVTLLGVVGFMRVYGKFGLKIIVCMDIRQE